MKLKFRTRLIGSGNIWFYSHLSVALLVLSMVKTVLLAYETNLLFILMGILSIFIYHIMGIMNKIEKIQERFEFTEVFIDHKGVKNESLYVLLFDKENLDKSSLLIKSKMDESFTALYESQFKRLKIIVNATYSKDEINKLLKRAGLDEI